MRTCCRTSSICVIDTCVYKRNDIEVRTSMTLLELAMCDSKTLCCLFKLPQDTDERAPMAINNLQLI